MWDTGQSDEAVFLALTLMGNVYVCKSVCVQVDGQDKQHLSSMLTAQTLFPV